MQTYSPGDTGYDTLTTGFQAARPHRPDLVLAPAEPADVREALGIAGGRPLVVQSTGHGRGAPLIGGVLLSTRGLTGVQVDPATRTARIGAGSTWGDVVAAAAPHGLAPLNGSSPGVGVVGYLRGGGFALLARTDGYAVDSVRTVDGITRDGQQVRLDTLPDDDVIVTAVEIGLVERSEIWAGVLAIEVSPALLEGWSAWTADLPETLTSGLTLVPFREGPPPFRGRHMAMLTFASTVDSAEVVAPLRALGEVRFEQLGRLPYTESHTVHNDPTEPEPYLGDAHLLGRLDAAALVKAAEITGPAAAVPSVLEVRHLGGALARPGRMPAPYREAGHLVRAVTILDGVTDADARALHTDVFAGFTADLGRVPTFAYGR